MGLSRAALALALALLPCVPAAAEEWAEFDRPYLETAVALLKRLPSTREVWRFTARERIALEVTDNPAHVDDNTLGAYDMVERHIYIDEVVLIREAETLADAGVSARTTAEVLAWKSLPVVVHELTHGLVHDEVRRMMGRAFIFPTLEDEQIAFYAGCLALFDMFDEKPDLWSKERLLEMDETEGRVLQAWLIGPRALERLVALLYEGRPSLLEDDDKELLAVAQRRVDATRERLAAMRSTQRAVAEHGPEMAGVSQRFLRELPKALAYEERALAILTDTRDILSDPAALARLRAHYKKGLEERRARLESRRPAKT
ncbi:MAG: hypothetical protein FD126_3191 [Elusimicrobia bacterium]|nr:MAG: hypothetical protein FD126_3191 [Elusimicrobiota bacterium]